MGFMPDGFAYPCARFGSNRTSPLYDANTDTLFWENIQKFLVSGITNPQTFEKCKGCEIYQYCNAGCTYSQLEYGGPVDSVCKLLKILYKNTIRINKTLKNSYIYQKMLKKTIRSTE
jgi:radical SAM protein with 4Fe4S-binding SPASM domain